MLMLSPARAAARTIPGRLAALVTLAMTALMLVGGVVLSLELAQQHAVDRLVAFREILSRQQDADMMHDAIRSEVYTAFSDADQPDRAATAEVALRAHRDRAARAFIVNRAQLNRVQADPAVIAAVDATAAEFSRYTASAQEALAVLDRRGVEAATGSRADFDARFRRLEEHMAGLSARLVAASEEAGDIADAAGTRARSMTVAVSLLALLGVGGLGWATWRGTRAVLADKARAEQELRRMADDAAAEARRHQFGSELGDALEMADTEEAAHRVVGTAVAVTVPDHPAELLLADSSQAGLLRVVEHPVDAGPGCSVTSPWECVAVRRGRTQEFSHGTALNACPKLREHPNGPVSALCVPVTFMGRPLGVLHTTGPDGQPPAAESAERLVQIATQAGTRIGTLRATRRTELQASTDGLTGLLNRRSLEAAVLALQQASTPFALAMADLDHFKQLNDTYGHDVGDRALRLFANVLRASLRSDDVVARHGGEEFVIVLPRRSMIEATVTLDRLRVRLAEASQSGGTPSFTASFGLADTEDGVLLEEILRVADGRLRAAKLLGRDRVVTTDGPDASPSTTTIPLDRPRPEPTA